MMKRIIICFLGLLFSVWLGVIMYRNPGYVLVSYHGWSIETSLWFAVAILVALFILLYLLLRFSSKVKSITMRITQWISSRRKRRAQAQTILGLYDFVEGNWARSEKRLSRAAKYSDMPLINYLAAAHMAQRQQSFERRDNYLLLAQKVDTANPIAVGLTQARLQIFNQQWEEALATLQHLHQLQPKNAFILQMLEQAHLELKDWSGLKILLPVLRKYHVFRAEEIDQLELKVYTELLLRGVKKETIEILWVELPRYLQKHPALIAIYAEYLLTKHRAEEAEVVLKVGLHRGLYDKLLRLYTILPSTNLIKKIARAEIWLKSDPENAGLLLCLGRICKQQKLWGKARQYLEKSARLAPTAAVYLELGEIMELQHDLQGALNYYTKGLQTAVSKET